MSYQSLKKSVFVNGDFSIVPLRENDMESIRQLRNAQMNVLRQKLEITKESQQLYFQNVVSPLFLNDSPTQLLFSFLQNDNVIGYGGLVNISWQDKRAEMSFLVKPEITSINSDYKKAMSEFISLTKELVFKEMNFNRLFTETYAFRDLHISILLENGFKEEGQMREHIFENGKFYDSIVHSILKEDDDVKS